MAPKRRRLVTATLLGAGALASASQASAQEQPGYASNHFQPSERGSQWFALDSLDLRGSGRLAIGAVNDYSYRSLVAYASDGTVDASIVRNQLTTHLGGAVVLADRVRIGLSVPLQLFADGHTASINGVTFRPSDEVAVGDVRLSGDVRLFGVHGDAGTLAAGAELYVPSGQTSAYTGDGEPRVAPRLLFAGRTDSFAYAARAGVMVRGREEDYGDGRIGTSLNAGLSAGLLLADGKVLVGPELFGSTVLSKGHAFEARTTPVEALLGTHVDLGSDVRLGAGVGAGLTRGYGAPVFRGLLSIEWVPGDAPAPKVEAKVEAPKPPPPDSDGDGIPDCEDACSRAAGPRSDVAEKNGCPPVDSDKDGIPDDVDACRLVPGVAEANGCPADTDKDGIPDAEDACPQEAGPKSLDPRKNGCAVKDKDGDGILDADDACPNEPGKADPDPKKNGCPKAFLSGTTITITDQVKFKTGSAEILGKESDDVLGAVLDVLKAHPEIAKVRIEGHTDDRGDAKANKALSQARAASVAKWLEGKGIDKARLAPAGFGSEKPLGPNTTEEGRTGNRRVEFHVEQGSAK